MYAYFQPKISVAQEETNIQELIDEKYKYREQEKRDYLEQMKEDYFKQINN